MVPTMVCARTIINNTIACNARFVVAVIHASFMTPCFIAGKGAEGFVQYCGASLALKTSLSQTWNSV